MQWKKKQQGEHRQTNQGVTQNKWKHSRATISGARYKYGLDSIYLKTYKESIISPLTQVINSSIPQGNFSTS